MPDFKSSLVWQIQFDSVVCEMLEWLSAAWNAVILKLKLLAETNLRKQKLLYYIEMLISHVNRGNV